MSLELSLEEVMFDYSKGVSLTAPDLQGIEKNTNMFNVVFYQRRRGRERGRGIAIVFSSNRSRGTKKSTHQETIKMNTFLASS